MHGGIATFEFGAKVRMQDVDDALGLALLAVESEHGRSAARLGAACAVNRKRRRCVIDTSTPIGAALARVFVGLADRSFGAGAVKIVRGRADHTAVRGGA